jgi:hypothetical protein
VNAATGSRPPRHAWRAPPALALALALAALPVRRGGGNDGGQPPPVPPPVPEVVVTGPDTCFEAHGMVEVRLHFGDRMLGKVSEELVFEPVMDRWIRGLDAWVDGRGFGLTPPPGGGFFVATGNEVPSGVPAGPGSLFDLPADGKLDHLTRSRELMAAIIQGVNDHIVQPLARHAPEMGITSFWDLKDRIWNHWVRFSRQTGGVAVAAGQGAVNAPGKLAASFTGWLDDISDRMGEAAEQFIWADSPWKTDPLFAGVEAGIVNAWYSLGYCSGYIAEQIVIGVATGGVGKIAVVLAKAGGQAAFQLAKRAVSAVWFRMHLIKKTMAEAVISQELSIAIERGLAKAAKEPVSATIRDCPAEIIEAALAREGFNRATFSTKLLLDEIGQAIYIGKLCQTPAREAQFWHRLAIYFQIMGDDATANASKGLVRAYNRLLKFEGDELIEDRLGDFFTALRCESLAEGRQLARDSMEEFATRAAPARGNEAFKLSAKVAEVYPELYHYKPAKDFLYTRFENGAFKMDARDQGKHYLTPSADATPGSLQLSQIPGVSVAERARYRLKFRVEQIKEKLEIPYSNDLHNGGVTDRLEPITRDNPHLGPGGCVQFTTDAEIVIDEVFDTVLQRNLTTAEVQQLINSATSL